MSVKLEIYKAAIVTAGAKDIASESDCSTEAKTCNTLFPIFRDSVLRDFNFNFARKAQTLALTEETSSGWLYAYKYPNDCLKARYILPQGVTNGGDYQTLTPDNHEIRLNANGTGHLFLCSFSPCEILYTARVLSESLWDSIFVEAMVLRLAAGLAIPLKRDKDLARLLLSEYNAYINKAIEASANEGSETYRRPSKYRS